MKKDRQLSNFIAKLVITSFDKEGNLIEKNVHEYIKALRTLPRTKALQALSLYLKLLRLELEKYTLTVESNLKLTESQIKQIVANFKKQYKISSVDPVVNAHLLGGLRIKIADMVYDDSIDNKILQIKEEIKD